MGRRSQRRKRKKTTTFTPSPMKGVGAEQRELTWELCTYIFRSVIGLPLNKRGYASENEKREEKEKCVREREHGRVPRE